MDELRDTIAYIREVAPDKLVILDVKRGDIGSTADQYAVEAFKIYNADALTVNPYLGGDTLKPYTRFADRGVVVLCKTSNPGSSELQNLRLESGEPLYIAVARKAAMNWNENGNICLVVGATYPAELAEVREIVGCL